MNTGLENEINAPLFGALVRPSRLGQDVCARTIAGADVALKVVVLALTWP